MISLQTNLNSLVAQQNLSVNNMFQSKTIQQLTSGYRINSSGDDAAGLAVANKFRNSIAELSQGVANGNDATAQLQIMDGGISNISMMIDRLKTLAMQSSTSTFSGGDTGRAQLNSEFQTDLAEIDRQAQSIGLNTGGTFAKSLQVYLGAGSGSQSASNSVVNIDLTKSSVDTQALGLNGVQAVNSSAYDLGSSSATSVSAITSANSTTADFHLNGPGFPALDVSVNLTGVADTTGLVNAINAKLQSLESQGGVSADAALKSANVTASIVTDSSGNQKLAFNSSAASFQVVANNRTASALMGNFDGSAVTATGGLNGTVLTGNAAAVAHGLADFSGANAVTFTFTGAGLASPLTFTLNATDTAAAGTLTTDLNSAGKLNSGVTGITASGGDGAAVVFTSTKGLINVTTSGAAGLALLGMTPSAGTPGVTPSGTTGFNTFTASGSYELASAGASASLSFGTQTVNNGDTQAITISANDSNGKAQATTITLTQTGAGANSLTNLDNAVSAINTQLQASNNSTLQQITAVKSLENGNYKINFISTLSSFGVSVGTATNTTGTTAATTEGIYELNAAGATTQGFTNQASQVGSGGTADISTIAGAQAAVTAISKAVIFLGTAQAAIGKGQNQLGYAISLATSQITNYSAAESQIRDANVAQQAANLSKAQVLSQASIAAMAQANSSTQSVLSLLRG
jgi:flagellin